MKIKTICMKNSGPGREAFDEEVNKLLSEGWILTKREPLPGYDLGGNLYYEPCVYAELEKHDDTEREYEMDKCGTN